MQGSVYKVRWLAILLFTAVLACDKDALVATHRLRASLQINATLASAGERVDVDVGYARTGSADVRLTQVQTRVDGTGPLEIPINLDLAGCLSDATRVGGVSAGCPIVANIVLRDINGLALDSTRFGPLVVLDGVGVVQSAPIVLQAPATLTVESGDQQLGWNGETLQVPVVVRLTDRAGGAIAARSVLVTPTGGGAVVTTAPLVTDSGGRVRINYRLGSALGAQSFRVGVQMGSPTVTANVGLMAVEVRRERLTGGVFFSCGIFNGGTRCWGLNPYGNLGNRALAVAADTILPVPVSQDPGFITITTNKANNSTSSLVCGLTAVGDVYCWGRAVGTLGAVPTDVCPEQSTTVPCFREPTLFVTGRQFRLIDAGGQSAGIASGLATDRLCGVTATGDAYCWGENAEGAVGDGSTVARTVPALVTGGHKWIDIAAGTYHTCGVTVFGEVYCWGRNDRNAAGALGTGDSTSSSTPRLVASPERFRTIDLGWIHSCALTTSGGVRCWGLDQGLDAGFGNALVPKPPVGSVPAFERLSLGMSHACATTAGGAGYCWGSRRYGNMGDGSPLPLNPVAQATYVPVRVLSTNPLVEIGSGITSSCGLTAASVAYCWGQGSSVGTRTTTSVPFRVGVTTPVAGTPSRLFQGTNGMPEWAVSGSACPATLSAQAYDNDGYFAAGVTVQFFARTAGASVSAGSATTNASGVATVNCIVSSTIGLNTFVARAPGIADSVVITTNGQVPGPARNLFCRVCTVNSTVGTTSAFALSSSALFITDSLGLPVQGASVSFVKSSNGATSFSPAPPTIVLTNANGEASLVSFRPDTIARADTLIVTATALPSSPQLIIVRGTPAAPSISRFVANPTAARVGQSIAPSITVSLFDRYGNFANNATARAVVLSLTGTGGGVLGGTTSLNTINGTATFANLTVNAPGTYQLVATVSGIPVATSAAFTITP